MGGILRKMTLGDLRKPSKPPRGIVLDGRSKEAWSKEVEAWSRQAGILYMIPGVNSYN